MCRVVLQNGVLFFFFVFLCMPAEANRLATLTCKHRCDTAGERDNKYPGLYVRNGTTWGVVGPEKADEKANEAQTMNDNNLTGKAAVAFAHYGHGDFATNCLVLACFFSRSHFPPRPLWKGLLFAERVALSSRFALRARGDARPFFFFCKKNRLHYRGMSCTNGGVLRPTGEWSEHPGFSVI